MSNCNTKLDSVIITEYYIIVVEILVLMFVVGIISSYTSFQSINWSNHRKVRT